MCNPVCVPSMANMVKSRYAYIRRFPCYFNFNRGKIDVEYINKVANKYFKVIKI